MAGTLLYQKPESVAPEQCVLLLAMSELHSAVVYTTPKHVIFKVKFDPAKHPKDMKGRFTETPDKIKATEAGVADVLITKSGKVFQVEKQTEKGVKVSPVDIESGEVKSGYTVLGNDIEVVVFDKAKGPGFVGPIGDLEPNTHIKTSKGKKFQISKHGKWTTVYPVDDAGKPTGKHTVLKKDLQVTVVAPDEIGSAQSPAFKKALSETIAEIKETEKFDVFGNDLAFESFAGQLSQWMQVWLDDPEAPFGTDITPAAVIQDVKGEGFSNSLPIETLDEWKDYVQSLLPPSEGWQVDEGMIEEAWDKSLLATQHDFGGKYAVKVKPTIHDVLANDMARAVFVEDLAKRVHKEFGDDYAPLDTQAVIHTIFNEPQPAADITSSSWVADHFDTYVLLATNKHMDPSDRDFVIAAYDDAILAGYAALDEPFEPEKPYSLLEDDIAVAGLKNQLTQTVGMMWDLDPSDASNVVEGGFKDPYTGQVSEHKAEVVNSIAAFADAASAELDYPAPTEEYQVEQLKALNKTWDEFETQKKKEAIVGGPGQPTEADIKEASMIMSESFREKLAEHLAEEIPEIYNQSDESLAPSLLTDLNNEAYGYLADDQGAGYFYDRFTLYVSNWDLSEELANEVWLTALSEQKEEELAKLTKVWAAAKPPPQSAAAHNDAKKIQEILPKKLPKVPKAYAPGVGKDTKVTIHQEARTTNFTVRRGDQLLGLVNNITAAKRMARQAAGDHEEIEVVIERWGAQRWGEKAIDDNIYVPGELVVDGYGTLFQVQAAYHFEVPGFQAEGTPVTRPVIDVRKWSPENGDWSGAVISKDQFAWWSAVVPVGDIDAEKIMSLDTPGGLPQIPSGLAKQRIRDVGLIAPDEPEIVRKARPERYNKYLQADWSLDELVGKDTNTALKTLTKIGYREIKPRQKGLVRVINANGKRIHMRRIGNDIETVDERGFTIGVDTTGRDLYDRLADTLSTGGDVKGLDPFNEDASYEAKSSHVQKLVFDMAVGKQNKVAEKIGKTEGTKVKSDQAYEIEIVNEGDIGAAESFKTQVDRPPYEITNPRARSIDGFLGDSSPDPADLPPWLAEDITAMGAVSYKVSTTETLNQQEATALSVIFKRAGVAAIFAQPEDPPPGTLEGAYIPEFKTNDPIQAARILAVESEKFAKNEESLLDKLPEPTRNYVTTQYDVFAGAAFAEFTKRDMAWLERAENKRQQTIKEEIAKRREIEGTVEASDQVFDLPTWDEIEFKPQTWDDIESQIASIGEGENNSPNPLVGDIYKGIHGKVFRIMEPEPDEGPVGALKVQRLYDPGTGIPSYDPENPPDLMGLPHYVMPTELGDRLWREGEKRAIPADVPAFYTGGLVQDGLLYHRSTSTMGRAPLEADQAMIERLTAAGAERKPVTDPINPGYNGSGKIYDGESLQIEGEAGEGIPFSFDETGGLTVTSRERFRAAITQVTGMHVSSETAAVAVGAIYQTTEGDLAAKDAAVLKYLAATFEGAMDHGVGERIFKTARGEVARSIEYIPHDQAAFNAGGAPTNQRGRIILRGYAPQDATEKLQELGIVGALEPEVPFQSVMRSSRRHGAVAPMHEAYVRGEAELPKAKSRITHGLTGGTAVDTLNSILDSGGLLSIAERHRVGIKAKTVSPAGDIRSGIDHGVFCTLDSGGACGSGSQVRFIMKPSAYLRRDIVLAPYDYGGCETRYPSYRNYLNGLQSAVGEGKTNLYEPVSPAVRQQHLDTVTTSASTEFNLAPSIPVEDMEYIAVPSGDVAQVNDKLDQLLASGRIASKPIVITTGEASLRANEPVNATVGIVDEAGFLT